MKVSRFRVWIRWGAAIVGGGVITPVVGEFFIKLAEEYGAYDQPSTKVGAAMGAISAITGRPAFPWIAGILIGFALGIWLDYFLRRSEPNGMSGSSTKLPGGRADTRLRIQLDSAGTGHYLQVRKSNVECWQQTIVAMDGDGAGEAKRLFHVDHLAITFATDIEYERPIIEAFGHELPGYNFFSLGKKGAIFQFFGQMQAPVVEIWFPPLGYYEQRALIEGEVAPPSEPA